MKKTILAVLAGLSLAVAVHADDNKQAWADYSAAKTTGKAALESLEKGNTETATLDTALSSYAVAASITANTLNRHDISAWMLNNRAYASILWFKNSGYRATMEKLERMPAGKDKSAAIADARATLTPLFSRIEKQASDDLEAAESASDAEGLRNAVSSNQGFLEWVSKFLEAGK
jgi:hypothetical protein